MPVFYHIADLHLGNPFFNVPQGLRHILQNAQLLTLRKVLDIAKEDGALGLIIAGDLFDSNLVSRDLVKRVQAMFKKAQIPIYILPGSGDVTDRRPHDALIPPSVYSDGSGWEEIPNVHIFRDTERGDVFVSEDSSTAIYGKPVIRKGESPIPHISLKDTPFHIAVVHGDAFKKAYFDREPDYPFTVEELKEAGFSYAALGHWHNPKIYPSSQREGDFIAAYPGPTQDLSFKDSGGTLIKINLGERISIETIRLSEYQFKKIEVEIRNTPESTGEAVKERISNPQKTLLRVELKGAISPDIRAKFKESLSGILEKEVCFFDGFIDKMTLKITDEILESIGESTVLGSLIRRLKDERDRTPEDKREAVELALEYAFNLFKGVISPKDLDLSRLRRGERL